MERKCNRGEGRKVGGTRGTCLEGWGELWQLALATNQCKRGGATSFLLRDPAESIILGSTLSPRNQTQSSPRRKLCLTDDSRCTWAAQILERRILAHSLSTTTC